MAIILCDLMTFPRVVRLRLMAAPSFSRSASDAKVLCLSLPARSTRFMFDSLVVFSLEKICRQIQLEHVKIAQHVSRQADVIQSWFYPGLISACSSPEEEEEWIEEADDLGMPVCNKMNESTWFHWFGMFHVGQTIYSFGKPALRKHKQLNVAPHLNCDYRPADTNTSIATHAHDMHNQAPAWAAEWWACGSGCCWHSCGWQRWCVCACPAPSAAPPGRRSRTAPSANPPRKSPAADPPSLSGLRTSVGPWRAGQSPARGTISELVLADHLLIGRLEAPAKGYTLCNACGNNEQRVRTGKLRRNLDLYIYLFVVDFQHAEKQLEIVKIN